VSFRLTLARLIGRLKRLAELSPYLYLLRVPLLTAAALLLLPLVALDTSAKPLLANLFDLQQADLWGITIPALTTAWAIMVTSWLIVLYAARRFKVPRLHIGFPPRPLHVFCFSLLALPAIAGAIFWTTSQSRPSMVVFLSSGLLGVSIAVYLLYRALRIVDLFAGIADRVPALARLGAGYTVSPANAPKVLALDWRSVPASKLEGQIYHDPHRLPGWRCGRVLLPGHALALGSGVGFFTLYIAIGIGKWINIGNPPLIPTLGYLLLLLTILCFGLTGLSFFFDRYRMPVLLPLFVLFLVTAQFSSSDHFFPVIARIASETQPLPPATALRAGNRTSVIVVAANGGGIQSAAWTAQVLTGLEEKCRQEAARGCHDFAGSLRLISGVSGGSVGAMYFVDGYDPGTHTLPADLAPIRQRAEASSLDDIAWGLAYPDLWRTVIPFSWRKLDRGMAFENALTRNSSLAQPLSAWRAGVREGWRPAIIFNATVVETGERLQLSTTDKPTGEAKAFPAGYQDLYSENFAAGEDVKVVTAARLSASYPFISPAARADLPAPHLHIADGGYYDNYGVSALVEWLDSALAAPDNPIQRVMFLEIRGAPNRGLASPKPRGWFYQALAPLDAMLNVRYSAQFAHNQVESDLLTRLWAANQSRQVVIEHTVFQFCDPYPPLSWHLSPKQKDAITEAWQGELTRKRNWERVTRFLAGDTTRPATGIDPCSTSK